MVTKIKIFNMKKTFIAIMAIAAMTACIKDEVVSENREAISFGKAFVDNATKATDPSYGDNGVALEKFNVYGTVTGNVGSTIIYSGQEVTGSVGANVWSCTAVTQYWIQDADYSFAALVDAAGVRLTGGLPSSFTYDATTQKDLLYATATAKGQAPGDNEPVDFTFNHLLAKAFFTFTNTDASANLTVTDIQISGLCQNGTYTVGAETPWATTTTYTQGFGGATVAAGTLATNEYERMILPGTYTLTVTFKINDDKGGKEQIATATIESQTFEAGHVYNFTADIKSGLKYIEFTINPSDWAAGSDNNIQG